MVPKIRTQKKQTRKTGQKAFCLCPCPCSENTLHLCAWKDYKGYPAEPLEENRASVQTYRREIFEILQRCEKRRGNRNFKLQKTARTT